MVKQITGLLLCFVLTACHISSMHGTTAEKMEKELNQSIADNKKNQPRNYIPQHIKNALIPPRQTQTAHTRPNHFDVAVKNMPAKNFYMGLSVNTPYSIAVSPEIEGTVSLNLKNVTLEEVMQTMRETYGFEYERTPYGYLVLPNHLITRTFSVNYLDVLRSGQTQTSTTSGQISEKISSSSNGSPNTNTNSNTNNQNSDSEGQNTTYNSRVITRTQVDFWKELQATITNMLNNDKNQSVAVLPSAGLVTVRAYPARMREIANYLDQLQSRVAKQVILEAKILEVELKDGFEAGIDWTSISRVNQSNPDFPNISGVTQTGNNQAFDDTEIAASFSNMFTAVIHKGDFTNTIKLLSTQGNVQVLSSPRISTMNNQKAVIKVGTDEFFVTGVTTTNTLVGNTVVPNQNINLTPFFSGINLDVTPQISASGQITLHIHPSVSVVKDQTKTLTLSNQSFVLPLALSDVRETDTIVKARNGQIVVIGGLMQNKMQEDIAATPVLGKIPFAGSFFRHTKQRAQKSELVILLRPVLVESTKNWNQAMAESQERIHEYNQGFHIGDKKAVFGAEGELQPGV